MITIDGYSKDPNIVPEGIAVTFGTEMMKEQGGIRNFLRYFQNHMENGEDFWWLHKCKNTPKHDISFVYVIVLGRIYFRCFYGGHRSDVEIDSTTADGKQKTIDWPHIILAGPIEKAPFKIRRRGFQGFRYTTKLF